MAKLTDNQNFLQPTGFKVLIDRKNYPNMEFFVQTAAHPSVSLPQTEVSYGRASVHMSGDKLTFDELNFDVILDEDMEAYNEMYSWLKRLVEENNAPPSVTGEKTSSFADISMVMLSSHQNKTKRIVYRDCVPTSLGSISMTSNTSDTAFLTVPMSFTFSYFDIVQIDYIMEIDYEFRQRSGDVEKRQYY